MPKNTVKTVSQFKPLFPAHVPVDAGTLIIVTGEPGVGKTTLATSLVPRSRLMYIDGESSGTTIMAANPPLFYRDVNTAYSQRFPGHKKVDGYELASMVFDFLDEMEELAEPGLVAVFDNPAGFKASAIKWAQKHAKEMGWYNTSEMKFLWGYLNTYLAERFQRIANKCGLMIVVVHLTEEYDSNDKPTGVVLPKIWDAVEQKASLVFWLRHGKYAPVPDALLMKARASISIDLIPQDDAWDVVQTIPEASALGLTERVNEFIKTLPLDEPFAQMIVPVFPPVIRAMSWQRVRAYCNAPYDPAHPSPDEVPTQEEWEIIQRQPSEFARDSKKLALLQAQQEAQEAVAQKDKSAAELKLALEKLGPEAGIAKAKLVSVFGKWTPDNHAQCMDYLVTEYPQLITG